MGAANEQRVPVQLLRRMGVIVFQLVIFASLAAAQNANSPSVGAGALPTFSKDIAPIIAENCIGCHTGSAKLGGLDLDTIEGIKKGGTHGAVLVPGKSAESRLYLMIAGKMSPA